MRLAVASSPSAEQGGLTDLAYFTLAWAFFLSAQYFFIRSDTAFRAAADTERLRF